MQKKYKMSSAQKRLYSIDKSLGANIIYNIPTIMSIEGIINIEKLERALNKLCERHEVLRTYFIFEKGNFLQVVKDEVNVKLEVEVSTKDNLPQIIDRFIKPHDLMNAPLFRAKVIKFNDFESVLILDIHHIICDGGSLGILFDDLSKLYNDIVLEPIKIHYKNYSAWQNKRDLKNQELFWLNKNLDEVSRLELITDFKRNDEPSYKGETKSFVIGDSQVNLIKQFIKKHGITDYMFFLSVFNILLSKYSNQNEFIIGTPIAGRIHPDTQNMIGMFVNTIPIKAEFKESDNFLNIINKVKYYCIGAFENQEFQFEELVDKLNLKRELSRNPLFDVMFTFNNQQIYSINMETVIMKPMKLTSNIAKFDLTLTVEGNDDNYELMWEYSTELFKQETIIRMGHHFNNLVVNLIDKIDTPINEISIACNEEKELILEKFNQCNSKDSFDKSVVELFESEVNKNPNNIAIEDGKYKLTYEELNSKANIIANYLRRDSKKHNEIIGVIGENKIQMIISIIGILKSGAAYMPIDIKYPEQRIKFMVDDAKCRIILDCDSNIEETLRGMDVKVEKIIELLSDNKKYTNLSNNSKKDDLTYIIYTSGTTGNPKGVMVSNESVLRLVKNTNYIDFDDISIIQTGSLAFDASTFEIWGALLNGGKLFLVSEDVLLNPELLKESLIKYEINTMFITTALFNQLIDMDETIFDSLDQLLFGGEATSEKHVQKIVERNCINRFLNVYGPTENTTFSLFYQITKDTLMEKTPIGKPISNTQAYVYNGKSFCGIGIQGELCLGGLGLAKGYLNNTKMTNDKFIENPNKKGDILYRTGDLVKWLEDGNIEYLGRIDDQVKIRGYRIELNEIENEIRKIDGIKDAVVVVKEINNNKTICAYFIAKEKKSIFDIKESLRKSLPEYMIPTYMSELERFPITKNGKISKSELPIDKFNIGNMTYEEPTNIIESNLASVFSEVLGIEKIGISDSFFELGGDSIKAIRILSKLRELGYKLNVKTIMKYRTIKSIGSKVELQEVSILEENISGKVKLTPIQTEFINNKLKKPNHFNQSMLLVSDEKVNRDYLQKAVNSIVNHHDMLRVTFDIDKQEQKISLVNKKIPQVECMHINDENNVDSQINDEIINIQSSFNLSTGPLFKVVIFSTVDKEYIFLCAHHLIVDGVSWRIIIEDINKAYMQIKNNEDVKLPVKTTSFQQWSNILESYRQSEEIRNEISYWENIESEVSKSKLNINEEREVNLKKILSITLDDEKTKQLLYESVRVYNLEINDILLTALSRTINKVCNEEVVSINLEGHGREEIQSNVSVDRTVGWFTSIYPVVFNKIGASIREDLRAVKNTLRKVPNYGIGYGIITNIGERVLNGVEAAVTFNYLGEFGQEAETGVFKLSSSLFGNDVSEENNFGSATIEVNGGVNNKNLIMNIAFDTKYYDDKFMSSFRKEFEEQLIEIIRHCKEVCTIEYTSSDFGELEWDDAEFLETYNKVKTKGASLKKIYPLTPLQEGMLYHKIIDKTSTNYVVQNIFEINEEIDSEKLKASIELVIEKHEVLRSNIIYENVSIPRQIVVDGRVADVSIIDYSNMPLEKALICFDETKNNEINKGFDLESERLIRANIIKIKKGSYYMVLSFHHIILDGWCISIIINDILNYYNLISNGKSQKNIIIEPLETYETYVRSIKKKSQFEGLNYWGNLLKDYKSEINILPIGREDSNEEYKQEVETVSTKLDKIVNDRLEAISKNYNVTFNTIIEVAWAIILRQYSNENDIVFGKVVSGRNNDINGIEDTVGLFINTVPVRVKYSSSEILADLLRKVQEQAIQTTEYDYCSLAQIQEESGLGNSLFNTLLAFENYYVQDKSDESSIKLTSKGGREQTNYDLNLSVFLADTLNINLMYDASKYNEQQMNDILERLKVVLNDISIKVNEEVVRIESISKEESEKIIKYFNQTISDGYENSTVIELFEKQVEKTPNKIAIEDENQKFTYKELNNKANIIANYLRKRNVRANSFIGVIGDSKIDMVIAIVGILKSGAAYMPIDNKYPEERIKYIVKDSECNIILDCNSKKEDTISFTDIGVYKVKNILCDQKYVMNLDNRNNENNLAYLIYTSGTTGQPKGVTVDNENIIRLVKNTNYVNFNDINILQTGSLAFDASTFEIWGALLNGGKLCLVSDDILLNPELLKPIIKKHEINTMFITTVLFNHLLDMDESIFDSLKQLLFGGEATSEKHVRKLIARGNNQYFINVYGPTENTTFSLFYPITKETLRAKTPIGKPITNTQAYIINGEKLCGIGVPGELYLGGKGVSKGYLNKKELSDEKFIQNPYKENELMYRTGDLARWLEDGNIEYLGRVDDQVKLRGYRIELGEIENRLRELDEIRDSVVQVVQKNENKYLYGYIISNDKVDINYIKECIKNTLPEYMIPNEIIQLEEFPKNRSGKVDKRLLPIPKVRNIEEFEKTTNDIEINLVKLFEEILEIDNIGINDDFFDIGGNSLKAIRLVAKIKKIGYEVSINELISLRSVRKIYLKIIEKNNKNSENTIDYKEIIEVLKTDLNINIEYKIVMIENALFNIIFVENLNEETKKEIKNIITQKFDYSFLPHYFMNLSKYSLLEDHETNLEIVTTSEYDDDDENNTFKSYIKLIEESLFELKSKVVRSYKCSSIQKSFIELNSIIYDRIILDNIYDENILIKTVESIINSQSALRSSYYVDNSGEYRINEHEKGNKPIYFDLRYMDSSYKKNLNEEIESKMNEEIKEGQQLSKILIIRLNEREFSIVFSVHHCIWDKSSSRVFEKIIKSMINDGYTNEGKILTYMEYVSGLVGRGSLNNKLLFDEDLYKTSVEEYISGNHDKTLNESEFLTIDMNEKLLGIYEEKPWDLILYIVRLIAMENNLTIPTNDLLPIFSVQQDRVNKNMDFSGTLGLFLDTLPILIDCNENTMCLDRKLEDVYKLKEITGISYSQMIEQQNFVLEGILSVNFLDVFELNDDEIQQIKDYGKAIATTEILIIKQADELIIRFPIYNESKEEIRDNIKNNLLNI